MTSPHSVALARLALRIAAAEEAMLDAMRSALVEGDVARAVCLLRQHLGLEENDAEGHRAAEGIDRGSSRP